MTLGIIQPTSNVALLVGDIGNMDLVKNVIRDDQVDSVLPFVAKITVPESISDPLGYYLNNEPHLTVGWISFDGKSDGLNTPVPPKNVRLSSSAGFFQGLICE